MTILETEIFRKKIKISDRIFGLDVSKNKIGIAIGDYENQIATSIFVIDRKKFSLDMKVLEGLIKEYGVSAIVVGLPLHMNGDEGIRCQSVRDFSAELNRFFDDKLLITFQDERLSTNAVESFLIDQVDLSRKKRLKVIDKMAAQNILQTALDYV